MLGKSSKFCGAAVSIFNSRFMRYLVVGGAANILALAIYYTASLGAKLSPKTSLTTASGLCFLVSYLGNYLWSFRFKGARTRSLVRYALGYFASFVLQWLILHFAVGFLGYPHQWVVLYGIACGTLFFYALQRLWVFADSGSPPARSGLGGE
jgi:putative flippase GtrA